MLFCFVRNFLNLNLQCWSDMCFHPRGFHFPPPELLVLLTASDQFLTRSRPSLRAQVWNWGRLENRSRVVPGLPGVTRWRRLNWDIHSQSYHFGLVYDVIYQFIGMEAKNYKFGMFCQQCHRIHPWPQVMLIFDQERPPGFTPAICLRCNFVYISILENRETNPSTKKYCFQ